MAFKERINFKADGRNWISDRLLTTEGLHTSPKDCFIFTDAPLLKYDAGDHGVVPYRSFLGSFYQGGFSDHLPIVVDFYY